jgi:hypothetical protein
MNKPPRARNKGQIALVIDLLDQALTILDDQDMTLPAAKVDDARWALRRAVGDLACLWPK